MLIIHSPLINWYTDSWEQHISWLYFVEHTIYPSCTLFVKRYECHFYYSHQKQKVYVPNILISTYIFAILSSQQQQSWLVRPATVERKSAHPLRVKTHVNTAYPRESHVSSTYLNKASERISNGLVMNPAVIASRTPLV